MPRKHIRRPSAREAEHKCTMYEYVLYHSTFKKKRPWKQNVPISHYMNRVPSLFVDRNTAIVITQAKGFIIVVFLLFIPGDDYELGQIVLWEMAKNIWWPMRVIGIDDCQLFLEYLDTKEYV